MPFYFFALIMYIIHQPTNLFAARSNTFFRDRVHVPKKSTVMKNLGRSEKGGEARRKYGGKVEQ